MKKVATGVLIWMRMLRFVNRSNHLSNEFLAPYGLTIAQFDILNQIYVGQPLTQRELAEKAMVTQGGISRMLARLEKEGYIQREAQWKTKTITLTSEGEELMAVIQPKQEKFQAAFFEEALSDKELKEFQRMLDKVYQYSMKKEL